MHHPYKKYVFAEMATLGLPAIFILIALIKGYLFFILLALVCTAASLALSAMSISFTPPHLLAMKQYTRAGLLIFCALYLLFFL